MLRYLSWSDQFLLAEGVTKMEVLLWRRNKVHILKTSILIKIKRAGDCFLRTRFF